MTTVTARAGIGVSTGSAAALAAAPTSGTEGVVAPVGVARSGGAGDVVTGAGATGATGWDTAATDTGATASTLGAGSAGASGGAGANAAGAKATSALPSAWVRIARSTMFTFPLRSRSPWASVPGLR